MCLYPYLELTKATKEKFSKKPNGYKILYKILESDGISLKSTLYSHTWKVGINSSKRKSTNINSNEHYAINRGIHLYTKSPPKRYEFINEDKYRLVVALKCYNKDFVAIGNNGTFGTTSQNMVYKEATLTQVEFDRAIKRAKIMLKKRKPIKEVLCV